MNDRIRLICNDIQDMGGYYIVYLSFDSIDPTISSGGIVSFTIADITKFAIGNRYGLDLNEIV